MSVPLPSSAPAGVSDRRSTKRRACDLLTFFKPGTGVLDTVWRMARVGDVSGGGLRLLLHDPPAVGALLVIELRRGEFFRRREARVTYRAPTEAGPWVVGCAFRAPLADDEIAALLDPPAGTGQDEPAPEARDQAPGSGRPVLHGTCPAPFGEEPAR